MKDRSFRLRVDASELEEWRSAAGEESLSEWLRRAAADRIEVDRAVRVDAVERGLLVRMAYPQAGRS